MIARYYDYDRRRYMREYYLRNKHRKTYRYIPKGVMKRLTETQYKILELVRTEGRQLFKFVDTVRYWKGKLTYEVNPRSVECLLRSGHLALQDDHRIILTDKGRNHIQSEPKCRKTQKNL